MSIYRRRVPSARAINGERECREAEIDVTQEVSEAIERFNGNANEGPRIMELARFPARREYDS
jgi:hypothetical protein